jgi:hypothetical protein
MCGYDTRQKMQKLSFSLGKYTAVFQAEVYTIKACALENLDKRQKGEGKVKVVPVLN